MSAATCTFSANCPEPPVTRVLWTWSDPEGDHRLSESFCEEHTLWAQGPLPLTAFRDDHKAKCKSCDAPIRWHRTKDGKNMPIDETGEPHWATCPQADLWRKPV